MPSFGDGVKQSNVQELKSMKGGVSKGYKAACYDSFQSHFVLLKRFVLIYGGTKNLYNIPGWIIKR